MTDKALSPEQWAHPVGARYTVVSRHTQGPLGVSKGESCRPSLERSVPQGRFWSLNSSEAKDKAH